MLHLITNDFASNRNLKVVFQFLFFYLPVFVFRCVINNADCLSCWKIEIWHESTLEKYLIYVNVDKFVIIVHLTR